MKLQVEGNGDGDYLVSIPKRVSEALKLESSSTALCTMQIALVSIPKRVSEALKLFRRLHLGFEKWVSIPKRVSEALKRVLIFTDIRMMNPKFQSLKGFQRL